MATFRTNSAGQKTQCVYHIDTPDSVVTILESLLNSHRTKRIRLFYGDTNRADFESVHERLPDAGADWGEENDVSGYIGRSIGTYPIPLLIRTKNSSGGGGIIDSAIVRIFVDGREVYRHENYHNNYDNATIVSSDLPQYTHAVQSESGEIQAHFHSEKSANNWLKFMQGKRMSK